MQGPQTVSESLVYEPRPSAVSGAKLRQNIPCYNLSTATPGRVIMFNIPCGRRGQFLSPRASYFKFRVTSTVAAAASPGTQTPLDYSAHSFISRLELYHGSNLLEQISEYHVLAHLLKDIQTGADNQLTVGNALEGIASARVGEGLQGAISGAGAAAAVPRVFTIQLLSGLIGGLQEKYLPVGEMVGDLRLELTLAPAGEAVIGTNPSWSIDQMELMLEYVELSDTATAMVAQQNAGGIFLSYDSFANYSSTIANGQTTMNVLIPARYSVLKTLFTSIRNDTFKLASGSKSVTGRANLFIGDNAEWYFSIGGKNIPATPVKSDTEAFAEVMKAQHALGSVDAPSVLTQATWRATTHDGSYIIATDLEYLHGKSSRASNGVNTLAVNTHLIGRFAAATGSTHTVDTFAHYEGVLMIINGIAAVQI